MLAVGSTDSKVHCWSTETGAKIAILQSDHPGPIQNIHFNPKYMMMATACTNMVSSFFFFTFFESPYTHNHPEWKL